MMAHVFRYFRSIDRANELANVYSARNPIQKKKRHPKISVFMRSQCVAWIFMNFRTQLTWIFFLIIQFLFHLRIYANSRYSRRSLVSLFSKLFGRFEARERAIQSNVTKLYYIYIHENRNQNIQRERYRLTHAHTQRYGIYI